MQGGVNCVCSYFSAAPPVELHGLPLTQRLVSALKCQHVNVIVKVDSSDLRGDAEFKLNVRRRRAAPLLRPRSTSESTRQKKEKQEVQENFMGLPPTAGEPEQKHLWLKVIVLHLVGRDTDGQSSAGTG